MYKISVQVGDVHLLFPAHPKAYTLGCRGLAGAVLTFRLRLDLPSRVCGGHGKELATDLLLAYRKTAAVVERVVVRGNHGSP